MAEQKLLEPGALRIAPGRQAGNERDPKPERDADHDRGGRIVAGAREPAHEHERSEPHERRHQRPGQQRRQIPAARDQKTAGHAHERRMGGGIAHQRPLAEHAECPHHAGGEANRRDARRDHQGVVGDADRDHGVRPRAATALASSSSTSIWPA